MCHGQKYHDRIRQGIPIEFSHGLPGLRRWQHSTGPRPANDTFPAIFEIFTDGMPLAFNFREEIDSPKR
jgi:hypothetical protein